MRAASSQARRAPHKDVPAIDARHSRVQSSTAVVIRNRHPSVRWSVRKSNVPRWIGANGSAIHPRRNGRNTERPHCRLG